MLKSAPMTYDLAGKAIVLGVTGGIAAYKAADLCRRLVKSGAEVRVVMTEAACQFITPLTLQTLSGHEVARDIFAPVPDGGIGHIELASRADLVVIAPATADAIARFAAGMADDLLAAVVLATRAPVLLAPAMNTNMWENPITQENLQRLCRGGRVTSIGPDAGDLACGWVGAGRMVDPDAIVAAAHARLFPLPVPARVSGALGDRHIVVTAGPTWEAVDDVRFLGNRSSGKMGFALAEDAAKQGAQVTLIAGPVALPTPAAVAKRIDVESALEMRDALHKVLPLADVVVMAAAVADFRPGVRVLGKLSRRDAQEKTSKTSKIPKVAKALPLVANPDLLAELGRLRTGRRPYLIGFAAEVGASGPSLEERARIKLVEKSCDVVVANEVGRPGLGFGADENAVTLVFADGRAAELPPARKDVLAHAIWDRLAPELAATEDASAAAADSTKKMTKQETRRAKRAKGKHA
jgi:phosphopantothenoylcysteine decarboxylase/phosphopantothenate--cysteine ligase